MILAGVTWRFVDAVFVEHDGHSYLNCADYSDIRCQSAALPMPARILILSGILVIACVAIFATLKYVAKSLRVSN
jgi:hypothetical protein